MVAPPALKAVHPPGKSPVLVVSDAGVTLVETGAIVEHLVEVAGGRLGAPDDPSLVRLHRQWLHYAEGSLMPPLLLKLVLSRLPMIGRVAIRRIQRMVDVHLEFVEAELARRRWRAALKAGGPYAYA